jgi:hypothetical protein
MLPSLIRFSFLVFSVETILTGPGAWLTIFGLSIRKVLFIALLAQLLTYAILCKPRLVSQNLSSWFFFFLFFVLWGWVIPVSYGTDIALSFADFSPLFGLCIIPVLASVYDRPSAWLKDKSLIIASLNCLAILHIVIWIYATISADYGNAIVQFMRDVLEPDVDENESLLYLNYSASGVFRAQWGSSIFLLLGLYFAIKQFQSRALSVFPILILLIQIGAIFTTQSRGFALSAAVGLMVFAFGRRFFPKEILPIHIFTCIISLFLITFILVPFYSPEFLSTIGLNREGSDDIRAEQLRPIFQKLYEYPFLGIGFGGGIDIIRSYLSPYAYEISILALYMKLGLLGSIWIIFLTTRLVFFLLEKIKLNDSQKKDFSLIYATFFAFVFMTNSNPYLSNFFGILIVTILLIELKLVSLQKIQ